MKYCSPKNEKELLNLFDEYSNYYILNGGTDLIVQANEQELEDYLFIDISKIEELNYIREDKDNVYIGGNVKYWQIIESTIINDKFNGLIQVASEIGSTQIRNLGTMAGNIANASPGGDSPVILENLDASVLLKSKKESRVLSIDEFVTGFRKSALLDKEYIKEVIIKKDKKYSFFKKYGIGHKEKVIIANASMATSFNVYDNKLSDVKVTLGACSTKFRNNKVLSDYLENKNVEQINVNEWLNLVDVELKNLTNDFFYDMKKGHLKGSASDTIDYIISVLEVK